MKTELVNNTANEAIYQLQNNENSYLAHKEIIEKLFRLFLELNI